MTFRNLLKRSSSENDGLDQALNAWVTGERHSERSEESRLDDSGHQSEFTYALEFHRWAEEARRSDPAASGPAADTWNRVLRSTAQAQSRGGDMSSVAMSTAPQAAIVYDSRPFNRGQIARYLNYAASLLIVFGVAFAGAFMAMQMNQPENSNGQFALFSQTDDSSTCDVEPLTVDRVMEIVRNPYPFMLNGPLGEPAQPENPENSLYTGLREGEWWEHGVIATGERSAPPVDVYADSSEFANTYLDCVLTGTVGQIWTFYSPVQIQSYVLAEFPVFATEDDVRASVEARITGNADGEYAQYQWIKESLNRMNYAQASVNPDRELALMQSTWGGSYIDSVVTFGVQVDDADGKTTFLSTATGNILISSGTYGNAGLTISVGKDRLSDRWYVLPYDPVRL